MFLQIGNNLRTCLKITLKRNCHPVAFLEMLEKCRSLTLKSATKNLTKSRDTKLNGFKI